MNEFNFNSYDTSRQSISYCEVDKCKAVTKLKKCLQEIKEIAENNKHSVLCFTAFEGDAIKVNNKPMAVILQKINECEV